MKETFLKLPRKIINVLARKDLTCTGFKVMLIILDRSYGYHTEKIRISASYIVRALGKKPTHSNINQINRALKELKTKGCILSYANKIKTPNTVMIHPSLKTYNSKDVRLDTIIHPHRCQNLHPTVCTSKDIKDKKEVNGITGPVSPVLEVKDLSYDTPKLPHTKTNQEITDEIAIMFPALKEAGITYSYGSNRFMDKDGKTLVFFEDISYDSKRKLFVNRAGEVKIM